ncbi:MAG: GGDEF domain-containing protein, partial [Acidobacteriaceae bacterium]
VGEVLQQNIRHSDTVGRLGGDEFAVILNGCAPQQANEVLAKLLGDIAAIDFHWEENSFKISASIGVASIRPTKDVVSLLKEADTACYEAKRSGRNQIKVHE